MREATGYTIQLYMADGTPDGLVIATQFGWTGQLTVCRQTTFDSLMRREDLDRPGVYILYGPDPEYPARMSAYIGEADSIRRRIPKSAVEFGFWELAVAITASDNSLAKGHVRYLEARLMEIALEAGRASLANTQQTRAENRFLPAPDKANMERFLVELKAILPVVGFDLLKPMRRAEKGQSTSVVSISGSQETPIFEIRHKSKVHAEAVEENGEIVVLKGSEALKNSSYRTNQYRSLKKLLVEKGVLQPSNTGSRYHFTQDYAFASPSAAAAIVLDSNRNGRLEWKMKGQKQTLHDWQSRSQPQTEAETAE